MSTILEIKEAVSRPSETDRYELFYWLRESLREPDIERLRAELAGVLTEEARGERVPLDFAASKAEGRRILAAEAQS